jgi:tetratricopeptide (TPR) repeat protein
LWGKPETLVALAAQDAESNPRPLLNLAELLIRRGRSDLAIPYLARAERILPGNYFVNGAWGRALACLGHPEEGIERLQFAARIRPSSEIYEWIGLVYGQMGRLNEAGQAFQKSVQLNPHSATAHSALALWYESTRDLARAEREYRTSVALDPEDRNSRYRLMQLHQINR